MKIENAFRFLPAGADGHEEMLATLVQAGYSNTQARRAVLAAICQTAAPASPAEILALGRQHHPPLGEVTVYRTLDILSGLGLVRRLHTEDGCHSYALASHDHGHHVICRGCRRVVEFAGCEMSGLLAAVERETGFAVSEHWLEIFGICPECQRTGVESGSTSDE